MRGVGNAFRTTYRHLDISAGFCALKCYSAGFQHGNFYVPGGQWGISTPGINFGWAHRYYSQHENGTTGIGGGSGWGAFGSIGSSPGSHRRVYSDWEAGVSFRPGGFWFGTSHVYHHWSW
jgi:hypothetical protein